jgi:hypothetical protein
MGECPVELLIVPKQLGHGLVDLQEFSNELPVISY